MKLKETQEMHPLVLCVCALESRCKPRGYQRAAGRLRPPTSFITCCTCQYISRYRRQRARPAATCFVGGVLLVRAASRSNRTFVFMRTCNPRESCFSEWLVKKPECPLCRCARSPLHTSHQQSVSNIYRSSCDIKSLIPLRFYDSL